MNIYDIFAKLNIGKATGKNPDGTQDFYIVCDGFRYTLSDYNKIRKIAKQFKDIEMQMRKNLIDFVKKEGSSSIYEGSRKEYEIEVMSGGKYVPLKVRDTVDFKITNTEELTKDYPNLPEEIQLCFDLDWALNKKQFTPFRKSAKQEELVTLFKYITEKPGLPDFSCPEDL